MKKRFNKPGWAELLIAMLFLVNVSLLAAEQAPGDLVFERDAETEISPFPPSIFQHWLHRVRYRCDSCHSDLFEMKQGATPVTMEIIKEGKACGACHDGNTAFDSGFENCNRCHRQTAD